MRRRGSWVGMLLAACAVHCGWTDGRPKADSPRGSFDDFGVGPDAAADPGTDDQAPPPASALDPFGIREVYPTKEGGETWFLNMANATADPRFDPKATITRNADGSWKMRDTEVRMNVFTSRGFNESAIGSYDPDVLTQKGYMMTPSDWKNIEITGYVKVNQSSIDDNFAWYGRGGYHSDSQPCQGTCYKGDLFYSGKVRFAKESWHASYDYAPFASQSVPSPKSQWIGFKTVFYNFHQGGKLAVKIELYANTNQDKIRWGKIYDFVDSGSWGGDTSHCGGVNSALPIVWGGPIVTFRWDNSSDTDFKWLSVREIQPPIP